MNFLNENVSASVSVSDSLRLCLREDGRERERERERDGFEPGVLRPGAGNKWAHHIQRRVAAPDLNPVGLVPREAPHPPH